MGLSPISGIEELFLSRAEKIWPYTSGFLKKARYPGLWHSLKPSGWWERLLLRQWGSFRPGTLA